MKKLLSFALPFGLLAVSALAADLTGTIVDANCGAKHADASETSQNCAKRCLGRGAKPVLVSDGQVLKIANPDRVRDFWGQKVKATGKVDGDSVTIEAISAN